MTASTCVLPGGVEPSALPEQGGAGTPARPIRVYLLDDHELVRRGMVGLLDSCADFVVSGQGGTVAEALTAILLDPPDIAVLDARLPDGTGIELCETIRAVRPGTYCVILTSYDDEAVVLDAIAAGASGFLLKQVRSAHLLDSLREVAGGHTLLDPRMIALAIERTQRRTAGDAQPTALTDKERAVLDLVSQGMTNRQIGEHLALAEKTVKNHVSSLLHKLRMQRRTQLAVFGMARTPQVDLGR